VCLCVLEQERWKIVEGRRVCRVANVHEEGKRVRRGWMLYLRSSVNSLVATGTAAAKICA
jgi:hypothetical protein